LPCVIICLKQPNDQYLLSIRQIKPIGKCQLPLVGLAVDGFQLVIGCGDQSSSMYRKDPYFLENIQNYDCGSECVIQLALKLRTWAVANPGFDPSGWGGVENHKSLIIESVDGSSFGHVTIQIRLKMNRERKQLDKLAFGA